MAYDTADNILNDTAVELKLISAKIADPYVSTDPNIVLLVALLKRVGQKLVRAHPWEQLQKTYTFNTANGTGDYPLPADYNRTLPQTHWNRTQQLPLAGPVNAQQWQLLKSQTNTGIVYKVMRIFGGRFYLHPTPTAIEQLAYEYISRYWVQVSPASSPGAEALSAATASGDTLYFDRLLLIAALKLAWLEEAGEDATAADREFKAEWGFATGADGSASPVLSINGRGARIVRMLDGLNIPETGLGS